MTFNLDKDGIFTPCRPTSEGCLGTGQAAKQLSNKDHDCANVENYTDMLIVTGQTHEQHQQAMQEVCESHLRLRVLDHQNYFQGCAKELKNFPVEINHTVQLPRTSRKTRSSKNGKPRS